MSVLQQLVEVVVWVLVHPLEVIFGFIFLLVALALSCGCHRYEPLRIGRTEVYYGPGGGLNCVTVYDPTSGVVGGAEEREREKCD